MESVLDRGVKNVTTDTEWLDVMMEVCGHALRRTSFSLW